MIDHDKNVGQLLDALDELGISDDTIVIYSTDNGPHMNTWPDGGMTPFRSEKNTNWEGAFRVPEMIRWPGHIPAGVVANEIVQHHDWLPTLLAAAGESNVVEKLKAGHNVGDKAFRVHIDGYNLLPYLTGEVEKSPRKGLVYFSDDGDVLPCVSTIGKSSSWSSGAGHAAGGPSRLCRYGYLCCSTSGRIRSSGPATRRTPTTTGCSTMTT
jgi:arylsulfatase